MAKLSKCLAVALLIFIPVYVTLLAINPYQWFRVDLDQYDLVTRTPEIGEHVIGYGIDLQKAELIYTTLRKFLMAKNVNNKVHIYLAKPVLVNGSIFYDKLANREYVCIFKQNNITKPDVIIYNGNDLILIHELTHFFSIHMYKAQREEVLAYTVEGYIDLMSRVAQIQQTLKNLAKEAQAAKDNIQNV